MKLPIQNIKTDQRIRQQPGDLSDLKASIQEVGLLNPVIINEDNELISGYRRLEACRQLNWTDIEVIVIKTNKNRVIELDMEYHENMGRLNLTAEDREKYDQRKHALLNPPSPSNRFFNWLKRLWIRFKNTFMHLTRLKQSKK